jgi:hypothetical protein
LIILEWDVKNVNWKLGGKLGIGEEISRVITMVFGRK